MLPRMIVGSLLVLASTAASASVLAPRPARVYRVTVTNLTRGQVFSPPVVATHRPDVGLFELGAPPTDELAALAENGMGGPIVSLLSSLPGVFAAKATGAPVPPGGSVSFEIAGRGSFDKVSVAGMLVDTNDAFFAIDGRSLPKGRGQSRSHSAVAYDAGSEFNSEDCAFIPGPGCGTGSQARDPGEPEGYVYISNGIHGQTPDLTSEVYDWHNPVAIVTIERIR